MAEIDPDRFTLDPVDALRGGYAQVMEELVPIGHDGWQVPRAFLIASLMASTLTEATIGRRLWPRMKPPSLMVLDGKASPRSIPWRRRPQNGDAGSDEPVVNPQIGLDINRVVLLERDVDRR